MSEYRVVIEGILFVDANSGMDAVNAAYASFGEKFPHECDMTVRSATPLNSVRDDEDEQDENSLIAAAQAADEAEQAFGSGL